MYNSITLIGNLGADPDIKQTSKGGNYALLSVATHRKSKERNLLSGIRLLYGMRKLQKYYRNILGKEAKYYCKED